MFGLARKNIPLLVTALLCVTWSGCCLHRPQPAKTCPPYVSQRSPLTTSLKSPSEGVAADFSQIEGFAQLKSKTNIDPNSALPLAVDLDEVRCAAARNSRLAELIEAQRHALNCRLGDVEAPVLDRLLAAEALEQRNAAAAGAGKLFLKLVEVELQAELLLESAAQLDRLSNTIEDAARAGFAMSNEENELAAARSELQSSQVKLESSRRLLNNQLSELIQVEASEPISFKPVYSLKPQPVLLDPQSEIAVAEAHRPMIAALESALSNCAHTSSIEALIAALVPALDASQLPPLKRHLLLASLSKSGKSQTASTDPRARQQQIGQIIDAQKSKVRLEVRTALEEIRVATERLSIINENVQRLESAAEVLVLKAELDARQSFREMNRNCSDLQAARSARISTAIEIDIAELSLLEAQGLMAQGCETASQWGGEVVTESDCGTCPACKNRTSLRCYQNRVGLLRAAVH